MNDIVKEQLKEGALSAIPLEVTEPAGLAVFFSGTPILISRNSNLPSCCATNNILSEDYGEVKKA